MYCQKCGQFINEGSRFCEACGTPQDPKSSVGGFPEGQANVSVTAMNQSGVTLKSGQGIACLVLGIASILFSFIGYSSFGVLAAIPLAAGILGLIFAVIAHKHGNNSGIRTAGFICSIIGVVLSAISLIVGISWAITIDQTSKRIERAAEEYTSGIYRGVEKGVEDVVDDYMDSISDYMEEWEEIFDSGE